MAASRTMRAISSAITIVLALFFSYYRRYAYGNYYACASDYQKYFKNAHFRPPLFIVSYFHTNKPFFFSASFLFLITITTTTTAIAAAQMNEVHHHEPIV